MNPILIPILILKNLKKKKKHNFHILTTFQKINKLFINLHLRLFQKKKKSTKHIIMNLIKTNKKTFSHIILYVFCLYKYNFLKKDNKKIIQVLDILF